MANINQTVTCPNCNAGMVKRKAKRGSSAGKEFFGCSRFPKCRGTRKIELQEEQTALNAHETHLNNKTEENEVKKGTPLTDLQKAELNKLKDRLLNVSSRNRSIRLNRLDKKSAFDLSLLNEIDTSLPNTIIEHCLSSDNEIAILPKKSLENEDIWDSISNRLTHLYRNITEIHQEKGLYDLYIGFPFLTGKPKGSNTVIQAPLFLIPVHLERNFPKKSNPTWTLKPNSDQKVFFNKTLFYALTKLCNLQLNQNIFDEDIPKELYGDNNFINWTHSVLTNYGVITQIDEDAKDTTFDKIKEFSIASLIESPIDENLKIHQYAALGHFPQSNSSLQKDYEDMMVMSQEDLESITCFLSEEYLDQEQDYDETAAHSSFDFSENSKNAYETIDHRPEKDNFFLLPSDSSQDKILLELDKKSTDGLVVWGPPGTGKSQTIVNIIADCIAKGKTVLLVSQKRAAIDVVYERLATKNMQSLAAIVHDTKEDRKDLYRKISSICSSDPNSNLHTIDPSSEIDTITKSLKHISAAYNDSRFGVKSGYLFQSCASYKGPLIELATEIYRGKDNSAIEYLSEMLNSFQSLNRPQLSDSFQKNLKDFSNIDPEHKDNLIKFYNEFSSNINIQISRSKIDLMMNPNLPVPNYSLDFKQRLDQIKAETRWYRFLLPAYIQQKKYIRREIKNALDILNVTTLKSKSILSIFLKDEVISNIDFTNSFDASITTLYNAYALIKQNFDSIRAIDLYRKQLPNEIACLESELINITNNNLHVRWGIIFKSSVYTKWINELEKDHPVLSSIRSGHIESLRTRLKILLEQKTDYCVSLFQKRVAELVNSTNGRQFARTLSVEVDRKRNIPSIRKLNEKFIGSEFYKSMLPVWLVSPESVSNAFPLRKELFDVVIFDEASQCTVENGLPAIFRGKQIVIAGDEKQLPPSKLFESSLDDDDEDSFATNEPSLLTLAKKTLKYKPMMLEWHYRSKHQELVTFSNEVFYNGRMKIAPNVMPFTKGNKPAIEWHSVTGYWQDRINQEEAKHILRMLENYLRQDTPPTLGVITFNINQKNYIMDLIDEKRTADPDFAVLLEENKKLPIDEQLFIKNIENVQGDERDVIIFSIAYAPMHPGGRVQQFFGLLNQSGGENRLNVAVTRAISRIHIVSSINPEVDLNTSTSAHNGPKIFQKYLCYAKAVAEENFDRIEAILRELNQNLIIKPSSRHLNFDSPFEEDVYNELTKRGYEVHSQVGQSGFRIDLAVVHPDDPSRYILGIECDGAMYHSHVSIRERDVFRQRFLETRGWKIHRVWSPSWRAGRDTELQKIISAINLNLNRSVDKKITAK